MSTFMAPVASIEKITPHTNADQLELAQILGWQLVVRKGEFKEHDRVVYFPPDTMMPQELSDKIGVTKYLHKQRVSCTRLRGEPSFGIAIPPDDPTWEIGQDVSEYYGVSKYEPPVRPTRTRVHHNQPGRELYTGELPFNPYFPKYTKIENMRLFPDIFEEGEEVYLTEKIHGTNSRIGLVEGVWMAGSHNVQRKPIPGVEGAAEEDLFAVTDLSKLYWYPYTLPEVRELIQRISEAHQAKQVVFYGEIYGPSIQSFHYGKKGEQLGYRVFDILIDGKFLNYNTMRVTCLAYDVESVPLLGKEPFSLAMVKSYSEGITTLIPGPTTYYDLCKDPYWYTTQSHMREGVVVRPAVERTHPKIGRCILKYVSDSYLLDKRKTDYSDDI
jgi:RNA ligase (TIGR02306 family)